MGPASFFFFFFFFPRFLPESDVFAPPRKRRPRSPLLCIDNNCTSDRTSDLPNIRYVTHSANIEMNGEKGKKKIGNEGREVELREREIAE